MSVMSPKLAELYVEHYWNYGIMSLMRNLLLFPTKFGSNNRGSLELSGFEGLTVFSYFFFTIS